MPKICHRNSFLDLKFCLTSNFKPRRWVMRTWTLTWIPTWRKSNTIMVQLLLLLSQPTHSHSQLVIYGRVFGIPSVSLFDVLPVPVKSGVPNPPAANLYWSAVRGPLGTGPQTGKNAYGNLDSFHFFIFWFRRKFCSRFCSPHLPVLPHHVT